MVGLSAKDGKMSKSKGNVNYPESVGGTLRLDPLVTTSCEAAQRKRREDKGFNACHGRGDR